MTTTKKKHGRPFHEKCPATKEDLIKEIQRAGSVPKLALQYDIPKQTIYGWIRAFGIKSLTVTRRFV